MAMVGLPPRPHTSEMTFWSRYDPVKCPSGNTDHWTKMKLRALSAGPGGMGSSVGTGSILRRPAASWNFAPPSDSVQHKETEGLTKFMRNDEPWNREEAGHGNVRFKVDANGAFQDIPSSKGFDQIISESLQAMPGSYSTNFIPTRRLTYKEKLRTSFNQRAKEGFKYWDIERPKPTKFGRYGIGSCKTVLGIGNAPRT